VTDEIRDRVGESAARGAFHRRGHRLIWVSVIIAVLGLAVIGFALVTFATKVDLLSSQVSDANVSAQENHVVAQQLSDQVKRLGGTPQAVPPGPSGAQGATGPAGRGITGTAIVTGDLVISYSDNTTEDKGHVVGADGLAGPAGRGITGSTIANGHLVLSYSDSTSLDVGQVVGKDGAAGTPGRGVQSSDGSSGRLLITYTDGTTQDAGPLPPGPKGDKGDPGTPGPACPTGYEQHEAVITANDGTKYDGVACVKPSTATTTTTPPPLLGNTHR
jgi:hypothetical protein